VIGGDRWPTPVLDWLQGLLRERFSNELRLSQEDPQQVCVSLAGAVGRIRIRSRQDAFIQDGSLQPMSWWDAAAEGWEPPLSRPLPAPGTGSLRHPLIETTEDGFAVHYDLIGLSWWMLSRREEVGRDDLDAHERFPAVSSHAWKHGYLDRPVVDEWLLILAEVMRRLWPQVEFRAQVFQVVPTHDADRPSRYAFGPASHFLRGLAGDVLRRREWGALLRGPLLRHRSKRMLHPGDPFHTFEWLMDRSEERGLRSTFYFMCGRSDAIRDGVYDIRDPRITALLARIHQRGHEIGLHPSYGTYLRPDRIQEEADRLRQTCQATGVRQERWGSRMHYLRWRTPDTLRALGASGVDYDSTLGYADRPGFRSGTCHAYTAFDPVAGAALNLRIHPLIAMERTIIGPGYCDLGVSAEAKQHFETLANACRAVNGSFVLLWHNCRLQDTPSRNLYEAVLGQKPSTVAIAG